MVIALKMFKSKECCVSLVGCGEIRVRVRFLVAVDEGFDFFWFDRLCVHYSLS
jgi:hypothetical protein